MTRLKYIISIFILSSFVNIENLLALSPNQNVFLDSLSDQPEDHKAVFGLSFTPQDLRSSVYKQFKTNGDRLTNLMDAVKSAIKPYVGRFSALRLLHPDCGTGFKLGYIASQEGMGTCLVSTKEQHKVAKTSLSYSNTGQDIEILEIRSSESFLDQYGYFGFDLLILDQLMDRWLKTESFTFIAEKVTSLAQKTPFILLVLPRKTDSFKDVQLKKAIQDPQQFFRTFGLTKILPLKGVGTETKAYYIAVMSGAVVGHARYEGTLKSYRPYGNRLTLVGKDVVVKQYLYDDLNLASSRLKFSNTLSFYGHATGYGFDFLPTLLSHQEEKDRATLVMKREGRDLNLSRQWMTDRQLKDTALQVLSILTKLEKHQMTPGDIKSINFVVNEDMKVFLIDYDNASFTTAPTLNDFILVCWQMVNGLKETKMPLEKFGILKEFVALIYEKKVKSLDSLYKFLK